MNEFKPEIVELPTKDLIPYVKNQKKHSDEQINKVAGSIAEFGFTSPIGVTSDRVVVFGHCRLEAAKKLGLKAIPCVVLDHLSDPQIKALRIADNKLNESEWDMDFLKFDLQSLKLENVDLENLGFNSSELNDILDNLDDNPLNADIDSPEIEFSKEIDDEKNDYIVFLFNSKDDFKQACDLLNIKSVTFQLSPSGNENFISRGIGRILPGQKLLENI